MFLKQRTRTKDGKPHAYYSVCEGLRVSRDRVVQRQMLHLGEVPWIMAHDAPHSQHTAMHGDDDKWNAILRAHTFRRPIRLQSAAVGDNRAPRSRRWRRRVLAL